MKKNTKKKSEDVAAPSDRVSHITYVEQYKPTKTQNYD